MTITDAIAGKSGLKSTKRITDFYSFIFKNSLHGVAVLDPDGKFIYSNSAFCKTLLSSSTELRSKTWKEVVAEESFNINAKKLQKAIEDRAPSLQFTTKFSSSGDDVPWLVEEVILRNSNDDVAFVVVQLLHADEYARNEIITNELNALLSSTPEAIIKSDLRGNIWGWNADAEELFGYTPEEAIGSSVTLLMPYDAEPSAISEEIANPERIAGSYQTVRKTKAGNLIDVVINLTPIRNKLDQPIGVLVIIREVIKEPSDNRNEELLEATRQELAAAQQMKYNLMMMMSHELRTPLTSIIGFTEYLLHNWAEVEETAHKEYLTIVYEESLKLKKLIALLLQSSQIERNAVRSNPQPLNVRKILADIVKNDVIINCESDVIVRSDEAHFREIISNMLDNADKYGSGPVTINIRKSGNDGTIEVCDRGNGVRKDFVSQLFLPFSQESNGSQRVSHGLGMGLFVARSLAHDNNGTIEYMPNKPSGALFRLKLPLS